MCGPICFDERLFEEDTPCQDDVIVSTLEDAIKKAEEAIAELHEEARERIKENPGEDFCLKKTIQFKVPEPEPEIDRSYLDALAERINYGSLRRVLDMAYNRAAHGKGKERHADDQPFEQQPIIKICENLGSEDGALFQAVKKIYEAKKLDFAAGQNELLDAIVYIAAAYLARGKIRDAE